MPWEYLKATLNTGRSNNEIEAYIKDEGWVDVNELGAQNYELIAVVHENASDLTSNNVGIFKRFVESEE